jgi:hypothetical protein
MSGGMSHASTSGSMSADTMAPNGMSSTTKQ